jgi:hypothetical protein
VKENDEHKKSDSKNALTPKSRHYFSSTDSGRPRVLFAAAGGRLYGDSVVYIDYI